ncbi:MAG: collagen binding domain-containing protein [Hyalangium sp.]|uniref:MSCRAMM family protein n=1 Tax=Hyalangium sp. TaxID=2028555 RepID=UPI00389A6869
MRRGWALGVGLVVLGAVAWLALPTWTGVGKSTPEPSHGTASGSSRVHRAAPQTPSTASAPEPDRLAIQGTVRGQKGLVPGARVLASVAVPAETLSTLACDRRSERSLLDCVTLGRPHQQQIQQWVEARHGEALVRAETVTAEDGTFTLSGLEAGTYALWVESPEGAGFRPEVLAGSASVELRLGVGLRLSGTVTDDVKAPVPGALVTAVFVEHSRFFEALTDATGHYQLGPLPLGSFVLVVTKEGLLGSPEPLVAYTPEVKRNLQLFRPRSLQGRVLLSNEPVAGAEVRATDDFGQEVSATTDGQGRFSLAGLAPERYALSARHSGYGALKSVDLEHLDGESGITLELRPAVFLEGVVRGENHQPLGKADVEVSEHLEPEGPEQRTEEQETSLEPEEESWIMQSVTTNEEGRYHLGPLRPGTYDLQASAPGYRGQKEEARKLAAGVTAWDFTLPRAIIVEGVLVDSAGLPVADELVELRSTASEDGGEDVEATGAEGHFSLAVPEPGTFQLKVLGERVHPLELKVTVPCEPLRIVVERLLRLEGEVVDGEGTPLPQIEVGLWPEGAAPEEWRIEQGSTNGRGRFSLPVSNPGRYVVVAELSLGEIVRHASQEVEMDGKREARVQLRLETGRRLSGVTVDWRGRPLAKIPVQLMSAPRSLNPYRCSRVPQLCVETDAEGRFSFQEASGDQFDVCVQREGFTPLATVHEDSGNPSCVRVKNDGREVRIVVGRDVFVTGRVVHVDGSPVTQFRLNGREVRREDGEISLLIHQPGVEQLELSAPGLQTVRRTAPEFADGVEIEDLGTIVLSP